MNLIAVVGSTYDPNLERLSALQPILLSLDHIVIAQEWAGDPEKTRVLLAAGSNVETIQIWMSFQEFRKRLGVE